MKYVIAVLTGLPFYFIGEYFEMQFLAGWIGGIICVAILNYYEDTTNE